MSKRWLALGMLGLVLSGCGLSAQAPSVQEAALLRGTSRKAPAVDRSRMEAILAVLAGKTGMANGEKITERGTPDGKRKTREYLVSTLSSYGYTVERHTYRQGGENLLARLNAPQPSNETVLVGAHFDSVRNAGANDNGTGTTAVLEAARVLRDLEGRKINVIFAFFDEEELGLVGSQALAKSLKSQGVKLSSVHTLDMIGWDQDGDRAVEIERPDGNLWDSYVQANRTHGLNLPLVRTNSGSTDHESFAAEGFRAVGICEEWAGGDTTPHYHRKTDTYETVNFDYLTSTTRLMVATIGDLACKVPAPSASMQLPHSMFPGREREFIRF